MLSFSFIISDKIANYFVRTLHENTMACDAYWLHVSAVPALESWRPPGRHSEAPPPGAPPPPPPPPRSLPRGLTVVFGPKIQL